MVQSVSQSVKEIHFCWVTLNMNRTRKTSILHTGHCLMFHQLKIQTVMKVWRSRLNTKTWMLLVPPARWKTMQRWVLKISWMSTSTSRPVPNPVSKSPCCRIGDSHYRWDTTTIGVKPIAQVAIYLVIYCSTFKREQLFQPNWTNNVKIRALSDKFSF